MIAHRSAPQPWQRCFSAARSATHEHLTGYTNTGMPPDPLLTSMRWLRLSLVSCAVIADQRSLQASASVSQNGNEPTSVINTAASNIVVLQRPSLQDRSSHRRFSLYTHAAHDFEHGTMLTLPHLCTPLASLGPIISRIRLPLGRQ